MLLIVMGFSLLIHLFIPALIYRGIFLVYPLIADTSFIMIIDHPAGLQMRIDRDLSHIFEAPLLQIFADPF